MKNIQNVYVILTRSIEALGILFTFNDFRIYWSKFINFNTCKDHRMKKNTITSLIFFFCFQVFAQEQILFQGTEVRSGQPCLLTMEVQNADYNMNTFSYTNSDVSLLFYNKPYSHENFQVSGLFESNKFKSVIGSPIFPAGVYHQIDIQIENNQLLITKIRLLALVFGWKKLSKEIIICK